MAAVPELLFVVGGSSSGSLKIMFSSSAAAPQRRAPRPPSGLVVYPPSITAQRPNKNRGHQLLAPSRRWPRRGRLREPAELTGDSAGQGGPERVQSSWDGARRTHSSRTRYLTFTAEPRRWQVLPPQNLKQSSQFPWSALPARVLQTLLCHETTSSARTLRTPKCGAIPGRCQYRCEMQLKHCTRL